MMTATQRILSLGVGFLLLTVPAVLSQTAPRITISGRVLDDSTSTPLHNADVFLAHTTLGCSTDDNGRFEIRDIAAGSYEIAASRVGYALRSYQAMLSQSGKKVFDFRLRPTTVQLGEVVVSAPDPVEWRRQLAKFTSLFLGVTRNAKQCKIANPEVLDFNEIGGILDATARSPIEIENLSLGYHIRYYLSLFKVESGVLTYEGLPRYTELKASTPEENEQWREQRRRAFKGSLRHFLISLMKNELEEEGYLVYPMPDVNAQASVTNQEPLGKDALHLILSGSPKQYVRTLHFKGALEVEYTREAIEPGYDLLRKLGTDAQSSWLKLNYDAISVNARGLIREWFPTKLFGYWAWKRMADALPLNYEPEKE